jgi:predicted permease
MGREFRYAFRHLRRVPRFSLLAIATLALAVGGTGALVSLLNALVLRTLDAPGPDRIALVTIVNDRGQQGFMSLAALQQLRESQDVFEAVGGYGGNAAAGSTRDFDIDGVRSSNPVETVTADYFRVLGVKPVLGRLFEDPGGRVDAEADPVVVISHGFWQRRFGGDASVIGRVVRTSGIPLTIIGVAAPSASSAMQVEVTPDVFIPLGMQGRLVLPVAMRAYYGIGRLKPGVTLAQAQDRLRTLWPEILKVTMAGNDGHAKGYMASLREIRIESGAYGISPMRKRYAEPLTLLVGLALLVLIVACVNVGGLLLTRTVTRDGELHLHLALGATRGQVARQLLAEGLLLSIAATCAAVPLAGWFATTLGALLWTARTPLTMQITPDARVLTAMVVGGLACGLIVSAPAMLRWAVRRTGPGVGASSRVVLSGMSRAGRGMIIVQLALSLALLFGAGLFMRNLAQLRAVDPGYRTEGMFWTRISVVQGRPPDIDYVAYYRELHDRLLGEPGVHGVALSWKFPMVDAKTLLLEPVRSTDAAADSPDGSALRDYVSPEFFQTLGIGLLRGRTPTWQDDVNGPPIAVINESLARQLFGSADPIGRRVGIPANPNHRHHAFEVVGLVRDVSPGDVRISHAPILYIPVLQHPAWQRIPVLLVQARDAAGVAATVRQTLAGMQQHEFSTAYSIVGEIDRSLVIDRTLFFLSSFIGGLALLLAALGLYALLAYAVGRRLREMGLRMALGASGSMLTAMVVREGLGLTLAGLALGLPAAYAVGRAAGAVLPGLAAPASAAPTAYGLAGFNPVVFGGAAVVLLGAGLLAVAAPARRAARTDPAIALRAD